MRRWLLVLGLVIGSAPVVAQPARAEAPVSWGATPEVRAGETPEIAYARVQAAAGRELDSVRSYYQWTDAFPTSYEEKLRTDGTALLMSVKPRLADGTGIPWAEIAAAQPGSPRYAEVLSWVHRVRDYGAPVWFGFTHEPETSANADLGSATDYVAAWRRWVGLFQQEGATNVRFLWMMTAQSFSLPPTDARAAAYWYPGDGWVDGIGVDAYNWFSCRPGVSTPWKSLQELVDPARAFAAAHPGEQFWVTEFGSAEDPAAPARKGQWYADAQPLFQTPAFAGTDGVLMFEPHPATPCLWRPDTSAAALAAWRVWGADPWYGGSGTPPAPPGNTAALVVGDPAALGADAGIAGRLTARGYAVTILDDDTVTSVDVVGARVVLISQSVVSATLNVKLRAITQPVLVWKPSLYSKLGMTAADGASSSQTSMTITQPGSPLAAGRSGSVALVTSGIQLPYGDPAATATVVGTVAGHAAEFAYPAGAAMPGLTAPACRLAFPMQSAGIPRLTPDGLALFDTAVDTVATTC